MNPLTEGASPAKRQCHCSGPCIPSIEPLSRRGFLQILGVGTAGALLSRPSSAAEREAALADWKRSLFQPDAPRVYRSGVHSDARMHLGGIGTGNFEIGSDGQLTTWQLFNTLKDGHVPFYFAARAGGSAKLLQTVGGPDWPRVKQIEMTGDYPLARLRYLDPDLPLHIELTAFSPFEPLDTRLSSMPLAVFVFKLHNPTPVAQAMSLAAITLNPVGYDATGRVVEGNRHPNFGANLTESFREGDATGLFLRAEAGSEATLDKAVAIQTLPNLAELKSPPTDRPSNLTVDIIDRVPRSPTSPTDPSTSVIWFEEPGIEMGEGLLRATRDAVLAGATLVLSGRTMPLLQTYAAATQGKALGEASPRPDIIFETFENGYGRWEVRGAAFGKEPARGTLPSQQRVSGFDGAGLVNTYLEGDDTLGTLTSPKFTIERRFIRFLVGGGHHENTQIRLLIDGKVVRRTSGKDNERLEPASWAVQEFEGKPAQIQIVDDQKGPWGHVNVDQIVFSDQPGNHAVLALLDELLPIRFSAIRNPAGTDPADPPRIEFENPRLRDGAREEVFSGHRLAYLTPVGKGRVALACGPIMDPSRAGSVTSRQAAYATLCEIVGARYVPRSGQHPKAPGFGNLALATLAPQATTATFDELSGAWTAFTRDGVAGQSAADFPEANRSRPSESGRTNFGMVTASVIVPPGATVEVPFLFSWHYPNKYNAAGAWMGCHYATQWEDARAVVREAGNLVRLRTTTTRFVEVFNQSSLPHWLLDCVTANAAIIRHIGVVFRIANGDPYGWEGSNGCCQPTCTHVWGYEQTLARLFPDLEREMRRIDFKHQQREDGGVNNRTEVPSPPRPTGEQPFADGHASCILKAYREALNCPDESFFSEYWPHIRRGVDYLIGRDAKSHGGEPAGYLDDDQWNTYDQALHGVTTFISGYYLAALRAGEEWAKRVGDGATAVRLRSVFERGQKRLIELCWNGEYFQQHLADYLTRGGEVGPGCMSDQLIGQWWAHQLGLGYLLPRDMVISSLKAVFKHNWKPDLTGWKHMPRAFAGDRDKGLIICTWPRGGRPGHVMLYSDEVWTGIEYQVAAHMIYEGLIEEGFAIVKGARDRYDGLPRSPIPRNPWNEIECGGHYARALSSWSLLLALSGWELDGPRGALRVAPRWNAEAFRGFFCGPQGWGSVNQARDGRNQRNELRVAQGRLRVQSIQLDTVIECTTARITLNGAVLEVARIESGKRPAIHFARPLTLPAGQTLAVELA